VFAGELGATLHTLAPGRDVDEFDAVCDHLVVLDDATAATVWSKVTAKHLAPPRMRVTPRNPWQAHDPDFDVADFYVLLSTDRIDPRYRRHFFGEHGFGDAA
jgi:putative hemolysin